MTEKNKQYIDPESEVWNIAKGFTNFSVLALLVEINNLVKVARFGCERVSEKAFLTPYQINSSRVEALYRIEDNLRQLYENTYFVMKKEDKPKMDKIVEELDKVKAVIDGVTQVETNPSSRQTIETIKEDHFNLCLSALRKLKREMHEPLNKAQLIFPTNEELDFEKLEAELIHGG